MKKIIYLLLAVVAIFISTGCRRASHNGFIDGNWRVSEIYVNSDGHTEYPEDRFICINLELIQLRYKDLYNYGNLTGEIHYDKKQAKLTADFLGDQGVVSYTKYFGIYSNPVTMDVERINSDKMVLRTPETVITCRRF